MSNPAADILGGSYARSWSWSIKQSNGIYAKKPFGTKIAGEVVEVVEQQQTDFKSGDLRSWPDGKPRLMWGVRLRTTMQEDPEDDGERTVWVRQSTDLQRKLADAVKDSGDKQIQVGAWIEMTLTSQQPGQGNTPKDIFTVTYTQPTSQILQTSGLTDGQQPVQQVQQQMAQTQPQQQVETHQVAAEIVPMVKQLANLGRPDEAIATALGLTVQQVQQMKEIPF